MLSFDIDKTLKTGIGVLLGMMALASVFVSICETRTTEPVASFGKPRGLFKEQKPIEIPFHLAATAISLPIPNIEGDLCFSFDRARPNSVVDSATFLVRLKKTNQIRRVTMPARIDFKYERELQFSSEKSSFWAELNIDDSQQILARLFIANPDSIEEIGSYRFFSEEAPVRQDFVEGSPLRILSEGKLLGKDSFQKNYGNGGLFQRLELVSADVMTVKEGDLLLWKEGKWNKIATVSEAEEFPLARVCKVDDKVVLFDAWGLDGYSRISVSSMQQIPFKTKSDEFITAVRVRSEKQISCMIDKQCFVLRVGDWVLKEDNRWKLLRKMDEKNAFLQGKLEGELFVFDRIDLKGGQKTLQGNLVNLSRNQMLPINVAAHAMRKILPGKEMVPDKKGKKG